MHDRCFSHGAERLGQSICLKEGKGLRNPFNRWKWQDSRESIRILGKSCLSHINNGTPWFQSWGGCQEQVKIGSRIERDNLKPGDIVYFKPEGTGSHTAVYLGETLFINASTAKGVVISTLENTYWNKYFEFGIRKRNA